MYSRILLLRSLSLYGTRSPQELLKASGLTQVRGRGSRVGGYISAFRSEKRVYRLNLHLLFLRNG